jgi:predicted transcriptional regulator
VFGNNKVDKLIKDILRKEKQLSTYEIAKKIGISWSTANSHCYKLRSFGIVDCKNEETKVGVMRVIWWLK